MKYLVPFVMLLAIVSCTDDADDNPSSIYPITYTFKNIDQSDEGLYLVTGPGAVSPLPPNTGLYGAYKDSLKMELRKEIESTVDLQEIQLVSETELRFKYTYQNHEVYTPVHYTEVNGDIVFPDSLFNGLIAFDAPTGQFVLCGVTAFALPGPNVPFPPASPYLDFDVDECIGGYTNQQYALDFLADEALLPMDTIGVLVTKYIYGR